MTIAELRKALNISDTDVSYDDVLTRLYALAKKIFYINTRVLLAEETTTDVFHVFDSDACYLYRTPVSSVVSIKVDGTDYSGTYRLLDGVIYFESKVSCSFLEVDYVAGYSTIPVEIDAILVQIVDFFFNYDSTKTYLSGNSEGMLAPSDAELPQLIRENMALYRVGI